MPDPIDLSITLDLDRHLAGQTYYDEDGDPVSSGPTTLEDVVIHAAATQLVDRILRDAVAPKGGWQDTLRQRVAATRDQLIADRLGPIIDEAITAAVQPTNALGEATCQPTTLRSIIVDRATAWLTEQDSKGGYGSPRRTNLRAVIDSAVDRSWRTELAEAVKTGRAEVLAAVRESAASTLAARIAKDAG